VEAASFAGTLGVRLRLAPPRDPEFKGLVERRNGFFETSFLPGRTFTSPGDFTAQIGHWLPERAATRPLRLLGGDRPVDRWAADRAAMVALPPLAPAIGLTHRVRLARDYYVRIDSNDYSVDPRAIGRFVDVHADLARVVVSCAGQVVADHDRCWHARRTITDPAHQATAKQLRADLAASRAERRTQRFHADGHSWRSAALPDYDALFGVDFDPGRSQGPSPLTQQLKGSRCPPPSHHADQASPSRRVELEAGYLTRALKTPTIGRVWEDLAAQARDANWSHEEYLTAVLERQVADRESAGTMMRVRTAHFPQVKTLEDFNLDHLPSLRKDVLAHLATAMFVPKADNVVLLGPPGIGKTHCENQRRRSSHGRCR
jgi:hypothetical protein